eukprot:scaffold24278_cov178-Amphora_coffeaeformis.AAC.3
MSVLFREEISSWRLSPRMTIKISRFRVHITVCREPSPASFYVDFFFGVSTREGQDLIKITTFGNHTIHD